MKSKTKHEKIHTYKHYYIEAYLIGVYYASKAKQNKTKKRK